MYQSGAVGEPMDEPHKTWEGTDLTDSHLPAEFNPRWDRGMFGGNGDFNSKKFWMVSTDGGKTWTECDTPAEYAAMFDIRGNYQRRR